MIHYDIVTTTNEAVNTVAIEKGIRNAGKKLGKISDKFVMLEFVSPHESQAVNQELRDDNRATDCISVPTHETKIGDQIIHVQPNGAIDIEVQPKQSINHPWPAIGQLIICPEIVATNAQLAGQLPESELEWVIEHGILHLMGFHHEEGR